MAKFHYWVSSDFHGFHKNMCYAESEWNDKKQTVGNMTA